VPYHTESVHLVAAMLGRVFIQRKRQDRRAATILASPHPVGILHLLASLDGDRQRRFTGPQKQRGLTNVGPDLYFKTLIEKHSGWR
jgi:hypothetical protein